jgi:DNA polymerase-3 subunit beta
MKLKISQQDLNTSIQQVSKAVSSRAAAIPILSGIKVDVTREGVLFTASDSEISIQSFVPAEHEGETKAEILTPGSVVLPAKFFSEIIRKLPSDEVWIESNEHFMTWVRSGTAEIQMIGMDPEEYPVLPQVEEDNIIRISSDLLKEMIRQTSFAVSTNESSPILTGVLWGFSQERLKMVACDRTRMASREAQVQRPVQTEIENLVIAGKTLNELNKLLPDENISVEIVVANNQVLFKIDNLLFYTRILDGTYPDTSKLIPQSFTTELTVRTKKLEEAIDRAYLLSREEKTNIVKMTLKDAYSLEISSMASEIGKVTEQVDVHQMTGDLLTISFNSKYMLDALKAIDSDFVRFGFRGAMQPIILKPEDHSNILHLIMPYRTTN